MPALTLTLLGPPHLDCDGEAVHLRSRKCLALLAYLAVTGRSHRRDSLASLLWPESDPTRAQNSLRYTLSLLRRALQGEWLLVDRETIGVDGSERQEVDVVRFRDLLAQCRRHGHSVAETCVRCLPLLEDAVELYQGDFMAGFTLRDSPQFDDWQALEGEALQRELASVLERLAEDYADQGDVEKAIAHAQRWLGSDPLQEAAHRCLMRLYAGCGRRSEALRQYEACVQLLEEELGAPPDPETTALYTAIRKRREVPPQAEPPPAIGRPPPPPKAMPPAPRHNLPPQLTPFLGREEELDQVAQRLADPACRLLTVVGPGGIGKSRLAIQAAEEHLPVFTDGVWFVPLASLDSVHLLPSAIMEALDVPRYGGADPKEQLLNYLRDRSLLLVLDGFEDLLEGATLVTEILTGSPGLKALVTSRERLSLREEWLLPLGGMKVPEEEAIIQAREEGDVMAQAVAVLEGYSAVELFVQCARQVQPGLSLTSAGPASVARICQLVEGMPLAIELAAPWMRVMDCEAIAREIEGGLDLLTTGLRDVPERHRSMRAVFDHSWDLLSAEERSVLSKLSVFRGGFRREAGEVVAMRLGQSPASLFLLSALVDRSWIRRSPSGRYEMHELVRQYCAEPLEEDQEQGNEVRDRHSRYFGAFLQEREERLRGRGQAEAFGEILEDIDNVWAAWEWAVQRGDVVTIGRCVETLAYAGRVRRWRHEMMQAFDNAAPRLRQLLDLAAPGPGHPALVLADMLAKQALLHSWRGQVQRAIRLCEESLALLEEVEPGARRDSVHIYAKTTLAAPLYRRGDRAKGRQLLEEALTLAERVGAPWDREYILFSLGMHASNEGQYLQAERFLQRAITIADETGEQAWRASSLNRLSWVVWARGEYQRAQLLAEESLRIFQELGDPVGAAYGFVRMGEIATALGKHELAAERFQRSLAVVHEFGGPQLHGEVLIGQGTLALAVKQYAEAGEHFRKGATIAREIEDGGMLADALIGQGHVALAFGESQRARECFCQALKAAMEVQHMHLAVGAVMGLASLLAEEEHPQRAAGFVALVLQHPATHQMDKGRAQALLSKLPPPVLAAAMARGQARELEDVAVEILEAR